MKSTDSVIVSWDFSRGKDAFFRGYCLYHSKRSKGEKI